MELLKSEQLLKSPQYINNDFHIIIIICEFTFIFKRFSCRYVVYFLDVRNKHVYSDISAKFLDDFLESCIFAILKKFTLLWKSIHIAKIWEENYFEWHHLCYSCFIHYLVQEMNYYCLLFQIRKCWTRCPSVWYW